MTEKAYSPLYYHILEQEVFSVENCQKAGQSFDCAGTTVTMTFSENGRPLQDCMTDILRSHMEERTQT